MTGEAYQTLQKPADEIRSISRNRRTRKAGSRRRSTRQRSSPRLGVDVAKRNVNIARSGYMPTIDLFANRTQFDFDATQTNNGLEGPADSDQTQDTIGIQVNIPIFAGGVTHSKVKEQVYLHRAERERLEGAVRKAERDTRDAYLGVIAGARVVALQQSVKEPDRARSDEAGFEVGTRTTVDVLDARRRLFEAQRDFARSRYDYLVNIIRLKSAAGVLVPGDLESINALLTQAAPIPESKTTP